MDDAASKQQLFDRVGTLEADVQHLSNDVSALSHKFDTMMQAVFQKIDGLSASRQLTWPWVWGAIGVFGLIVAGGWKIHESSLAPITALIERHDQKIEENENTIDNVDALRVEMRLLSELHDEKRLRLSDQIEFLRSDFERHRDEADHPWGVLQKIQAVELELKAMQANQYTSTEGAVIEQRLQGVEKQKQID